jgi:hypothetical protein
MSRIPYMLLMHAAFFNIRAFIVSKHSELVKRQARDRYGRFASPSGHTAHPPSHHQEVEKL